VDEDMIKRLIIILILLAGLVVPFARSSVVMAATETIRPDGMGNYDDWIAKSAQDWEEVDEAVADDDATWIYHDDAYSSIVERSSFSFGNTSGTGVISSIDIHYKIGVYIVYPDDSYGRVYAFTRINSTNYDAGYKYISASSEGWEWWTHSINLTQNPDTSAAWTWSDLDALEVGVRNKVWESGDKYCTQMYVVINYTALTAPDVTTNAASNIAQTTARLNSTVVDDGGEPCDIRWGWGTTTQSAIESYDSYSSWENDTYTTGQHPYNDITSLSGSTTYYFRVEIRNDFGTELGGELSFTTEGAVNEPDNIRAIPGSQSVSLSWSKGTGATNTLIRYSVDTYPTTTSEGTQLYFGTSSSTVHSSLESGTTIYYSAWGESGSVYSGSYTTLLVTTLAGQDTDVDLTAPSEPTNWFLDVDYTTQTNNPLYATINTIADNVNVPRATAWMLAGIFVSMIGGTIVYGFRRDLFAGGVTMFVLMIFASAQLLIPGWIIFLSGVILVTIGLVRRRFE
jgi:hypothetical protein